RRVAGGMLLVRTAKASGARSRTAGPVCKAFPGKLPAFLKRGRGTQLALRSSRAERGRLMVIQVLLVADDPDGAATTVSTTIEINITDPRWPAWLVDAITFQAQEGA